MFVIKNKILRDDFCRPIHIFLTEDEMVECFAQVDFKVSQGDVLTIFKDHNAHKTGYLPMEDFYKKLKCWRNYNREKEQKDNEMNQIMQEANRLIEKN